MSVANMGRKGVTFYDPARAFYGYNFFNPFEPTKNGDSKCWLMDMKGRYVNIWRMDYCPGARAILLPNGHVMQAAKIKEADEYGWPGWFGGCGGRLIEYDWDSNLIWQAEMPYQTHDFLVMPNGNILYQAWEPKGIFPEELTSKVKGGMPGTELDGQIWGDVIVEMDRSGNRVWEWIAYNHLDFDIDVICPLEPRTQWPYINSLWICRDGSILFSARFLNMILKIEYPSGKVIGRYGKGEIFHQHDAQELENGNITCFDNGTHRHAYEPVYSRAVEIDSKTDEVVWEYKADPPSDFHSPHSGGCERQPNGNTLIIESEKGRAFEVTPDGEIVWEWVNPRYVPYHGQFGNWIWRFHRYPPDYPGLKGKDLDPDRLAWVNRAWGQETFIQDVKPCIF